MSFAKYTEDNYRIVTERESYMYGAWYSTLTTVDKKYESIDAKNKANSAKKNRKKRK